MPAGRCLAWWGSLARGGGHMSPTSYQASAKDPQPYQATATHRKPYQFTTGVEVTAHEMVFHALPPLPLDELASSTRS